jgi:hypothetical protein
VCRGCRIAIRRVVGHGGSVSDEDIKIHEPIYVSTVEELWRAEVGGFAYRYDETCGDAAIEALKEGLAEVKKTLQPNESFRLSTLEYQVNRALQKRVTYRGQKNVCPKCGDYGVFIRMALCCPTHGAWGGI